MNTFSSFEFPKYKIYKVFGCVPSFLLVFAIEWEELLRQSIEY